jgi:hypothetical protein
MGRERGEIEETAHETSRPFTPTGPRCSGPQDM